MKQSTFLAVGTVVTAFGASMCCILPVAVAFLGVGSAAVAAKLEPFRPYFTIATVLLLGLALYKTYQPVETCAPGERCEAPNQYRQRLFIWVAGVVALALLLFPYYAGLLF